jgi:hypothetical protein
MIDGQGTRMGTYTAPAVRAPSPDVGRAELVFGGVEQAGPSFEGRVFLNRPDADETTPRTPEYGYAGSFHVFGYGQHPPPAMAEAKATRAEGTGPIAPIQKRVHANQEAVRAALHASDELTVTVVAVPADPGGATPERPFQNMQIVFDRVSGEA